MPIGLSGNYSCRSSAGQPVWEVTRTVVANVTQVTTTQNATNGGVFALMSFNNFSIMIIQAVPINNDSTIQCGSYVSGLLELLSDIHTFRVFGKLVSC